MSDPIIFIGHHRIKEGQLEGFRQFLREKVESTEADLPGTLVDIAYTNDDGTEATIVHLFSNAEAMDSFFQGIGDRGKEGAKYLQPLGLEVHGTPGTRVLGILQQMAGTGISVRISPQRLGGFVRLNSQPGE